MANNELELTQFQKIVITGFTGILCCEFSDFHADVELRMNRPVFTHEFAGEQMKDAIKELYADDFMLIIGG